MTRQWKNLPPLTTLPVLEAAARLQSFSAAAAELNVTHGAVSHQIRSLEDHLGIALFVRVARRVELTAEGAMLAEAVRGALGKVADAVEALSPAERERKLSISVLPSFGSRWLMPRLGKFLQANPQYDISVEASIKLVNFVNDGFDVAIRFGIGPWPGLHHEHLADDAYFPVCSPKFRRGKLPTKPTQLVGLPLFKSDIDNWEWWLQANNINIKPTYTGVAYNDATLPLRQAMNGEGIALTRRSLVGEDLTNGNLVPLFDIEVASPNSYYLVCLPQHAASPKVRAFRDWLVAEIDWA
jgi:LysR family transcriptional regulator, glycine cleavage system transcriptional activator